MIEKSLMNRNIEESFPCYGNFKGLIFSTFDRISIL
jgi:hypothetical protein